MLQAAYKLKKFRIKKRLNEFSYFYNNPVSWFFEDNIMKLKPVDKDENERIFEELVFCILTANTSAIMGLKAIDKIRDTLKYGALVDIRSGLKSAAYRYPNKRSEYIIEARYKFIDNIKDIINRYNNLLELREFFVANVKGIGYKESSHFLRNIGFRGLAILDKHILRSMLEHDIINKIPKTMTKNKYINLEQKYFEFANNLNIDSDELDLLL